MQLIEIVIVSADPLTRAGLKMLLADQPDCTIIGDIDNVNDSVAIYQPDVILYDLGWHNEEPLPDLRELETPVVALVADSEGAQAVWAAGAVGIVGRDGSADMVRAAVNAAYNGLITFTADYLPITLNTTAYTDSLPIEPITPREQDVLELLARGMTNRAIAHELTISDHTVKFHVNALLTKLGAQSRTEAAVKATRMGLLSV